MMKQEGKNEMAAPKGFKSVSASIFKFEEIGSSLTGVFVESGYTEIDGVAVAKFTIDTADGLRSFLGTVQLTEQMGRVRLGTTVYIEYTGNATSSRHRPVRLFTVMVASDAELLDGAENPTGDGEN